MAVREHAELHDQRFDWASGELRPLVGRGVVDLSVAGARSRERASDDKDLALRTSREFDKYVLGIGGGDLYLRSAARLVASGDLHVGECRPGRGLAILEIKDTGLRGARASSNNNTSLGIQGSTRAEHVVLSVLWSRVSQVCK